MVLVDTSVWIPFFNRPASREKLALDRLIENDEVLLAGIVLAELLQGCRTALERDELEDALSGLPYVEVNRGTWVKAGDLSASLLRRGRTLPITDLIIAALAIEHQCQVYSLDAHFDGIPGLSRYRPVEL